MQLHIHIDSESNARELLALSNFTRELSGYRSGGAIPTGPLTAPPDEAELSEPEPVVVGDTLPAEPQATEAPKRRRRTKAEMEADAAAAEAEAKVGNEAEVPEVTPEPTPLTESPAPTQTAPETTTGASQAPVAETPASASPSNGATYTAADVQKMAVDAARRFGPEKVKAIIAEYPGVTKIADLIPGDLAGFVAKLKELKAD